jgi:hypothetical protein
MVKVATMVGTTITKATILWAPFRTDLTGTEPIDLNGM